MRHEFHAETNTHINFDDQGVARDLIHTDQPFASSAPTPQLVASEYLAKYGGLLGLVAGESANLGMSRSADAEDSGDELRFASEKSQFDTTTVMYQQTRFGLPVWHGAVAIHMKGRPYRVTAAQSTRHADLDAQLPSAAALARAQALDAAGLAQQLGLSGADAESVRIDATRLVIYRWVAARRVVERHPHQHGGQLQVPADAPPPLPPVPPSLQERRHYVALEVHFSMAPAGGVRVNWTALLEVDSLAVLYLRAMVADANGQVFLIDPITTNGGPAPSAGSATLNPVRTSVALPGLAPASPQGLTGDIVRLADVELPNVAPPTQPSGHDFNYDARSDDFAAVNAYFHCDRFFRLMQSLGFTLSGFFGSGTSFPTVVDHRGFGGNFINAHCLGTAGGSGILQTTFALADLGDTSHPIGIACDYRVVLHELAGHGVLYPHVHGPNFGFSHSAGDSIAAITCDPETQAPDRFLSFPWISGVIARRHDRTPAAGWGWAGNIALNPFNPAVDGGGYNNEQILSTTLFRLYRSMGGDSSQLAMRQFAARYAVYLILRAIASLTPATNPGHAAGFATALIGADLGDWTTEHQTGGAYGKVIRWAFEQQGLYQPAGTATPNNLAGAPPPVDVYIDDGRHGEYPWQPVHWNCQAIWNRRHADGGTTHEEPVVGVANYAYVKIRNRGSQLAGGVVVKAYHANPAVGLVYPNDWQPMTTAALAAADVPPDNSAEVTVGPFEWKPTHLGHECLFMVVSADGDGSNVSHLSAGETIPEWRLVPNDNNIGQRNVFPVAGGGGLKGLLAMLDRQVIVIKNPHPWPAKMVVQVRLPKWLEERGWSAVLDNPGAGAFGLAAGELKRAVLGFKPGKDFTARDVVAARDDITIMLTASADGIVVGGCGWTLDPKLTGRARPPVVVKPPVTTRPPAAGKPAALGGKAKAGPKPAADARTTTAKATGAQTTPAKASRSKAASPAKPARSRSGRG